jgi:hypothetical protein
VIDLGPFGPALAREIVGERDVAEVLHELVGEFDECFAVSESAGLLFGLRLAGGACVAVKLLPPSLPAAALEAARRVQRHLHARGIPAPRPLAGPVPVGRGHAVVDEWRDAGSFRETRSPRRRRAMAAMLARLVEQATGVREVEALPPALAGCWERPHHPRFDFGRADGAWIDGIAARVRPAVLAPAGDRVVGHPDWNAGHLRWLGDEISAVYDWDLVRDSEANLVGYASGVFTATWQLDVPKAPSPDDADAFVTDYESAARRQVDRERAAAARLYLMAYAARAELSDAGPGGDFQRALAGHAATAGAVG